MPTCNQNVWHNQSGIYQMKEVLTIILTISVLFGIGINIAFATVWFWRNIMGVII